MRRRSGVALVVVLWSVAILASVTALASSAARQSAQVASNRRALATARAMAESGVIAATALIDDSLSVFARDSARTDAFLARLEPQGANALPLVQDTLADGVFAVTVVDVSARLDVNNASVDGLTGLLRTVTNADDARRIAETIDAHVRGREEPTDAATIAETEARAARDSLGNAMLGRTARAPLRHAYQSLDELLTVRGFDETMLTRLAPLLTVDGDGTINRRAAPPAVRAAASGALVDRPTRLLCISRGWQRGHPLTREIQAVYDVAPDGLRLVRWREASR